jgi:pyruvate/2-oxoglutarate dehydrogenase complex dihydrolipoamide acyltransferase (E2) component
MQSIRAPLVDTGTFVYEVHVGVGSIVQPGNVLVTLETPDMFWEVFAPCEGVVEDVKARAGTRVTQGTELLRLAAPGAFVQQRPAMSRGDETQESAVAGDGIHPEIARIMEESARQAIFEVDLEIRSAGEQCTPEQLFARQQLRTLQLFMPASNAYIASIQEGGRAQDQNDEIQLLHEEVRAMQEQQGQPQTSLDQLVGFWQRHPFLVGWFGASAVHAMKRRRLS